MVYKEYQSLNPIGNPLPPKQAHKGDNNIIVEQGNHSVKGIQDKNIYYNLIEIFHFPIRSRQQLINKIQKGGAAYERNEELSINIGNTWRKLYKNLQEDGNLDKYLKENIFDKQRLEKELEKGIILKDNRLNQLLSQLYNQEKGSKIDN